MIYLLAILVISSLHPFKTFALNRYNKCIAYRCTSVSCELYLVLVF